ncbi:MAG: glycosyltransferase family 2 protein [Candidatus Competibacterales bacterium]
MSEQPVALSIVSPLFNEQLGVDEFLEVVTRQLAHCNEPYEIICVNDGSTDHTLARLLGAKQHYPHLRIINLSRNFGKDAALMAGLDHARGDAVIILDADLQDPPTLIDAFIARWRQGFDVVLAKRVDRTSDSFFKRWSSRWFYRTHNAIARTTIPENVGDSRLITRRVVEAIQKLPENQRFMKGIFAWVGFEAAVVEFRRAARHQGKSKFSPWKLWNYALEGITSFSTAPLRIWLYFGLLVCVLAFCYGSFIVLRTLVWGIDVPGYASLLTSVLFFCGLQLVGLGILGEYVGRIYLESKGRPLYIVEGEY